MGRNTAYDAVVIGSGPNGLSAAIALAQARQSVLIVEAADSIGGGTRTSELTEAGFKHDICSAVHPLGALSPFFNELPLSEHGLKWLHPPVSFAHPLDEGPAVLMKKGLDVTAEGLGVDSAAWKQLIRPFLHRPQVLMQDLLAPLGFPRAPLTMARFGFYGLRSACGLVRRFSGVRARALFAGCAAHSILPLTRIPSAAVGLLFAVSGHLTDWPVAQGGSASISRALASYFCSLGGEVQTGRSITTLADLPESRAVLFDTSPKQLIEIAGDQLPAGFVRRLDRFDYGPAVFKLDWALSGPIPWHDRACMLASTVHVGGTFEEIMAAEAAPWKGVVADRPFLLVCQQSHFDDGRAPSGKHTGYAYCHVPFGCTVDMTGRIEAQIERFAPGFCDLIVARHILAPAEFESYNANYVGGTITGGAATLSQLFARPVARLSPYTTPNPRIFLCSASTPPGGGVHGMCGYHAAHAVLKRLCI